MTRHLESSTTTVETHFTRLFQCRPLTLPLYRQLPAPLVQLIVDYVRVKNIFIYL
jgi:hypothetical protein